MTQETLREDGKTIKALLEFFYVGKQGKSAVYATPEGNFLSPKAVENLLAQRDKELVEQKHYEIAMLIQAVELFMEKDKKEYGETPLHGKFKAFIEKYLEPLNRIKGNSKES